jgi:hypothetical protein
MKPLLFIAFIMALFSCKKDFIKNDFETQSPLESLKTKKIFQVTERTEQYSDKLFNTCLNEYIELSGTVTYYIKESFSNGYYLDYIIDLDKVIGVGEISGVQFKGGGKSVGKVRVNEDGDVKGKVSYDVKYVSPGGNHMGFKQEAIFIQRGGEIKVEFNRITPTCE